MKCADLHIHSSYSDGSLAPKEIISFAQKQNIKCISITDHDCISAQYELRDELKNNNVTIIPGVEFSSKYKDNEIHILGYYIDIYNEKLISTINRLHIARIERTKEIILKLKEYDINLDIDELLISDSTVGRGNINY